MSNLSTPDPHIYRSKQALSKAVNAVKVKLPFSPRKKKAVVNCLVNELQVQPRRIEADETNSEVKENVR